MRSEEPEAIALLTAILRRPVFGSSSLGPRGLSMCIFGLQGMSSDLPVVRHAIAVITDMLMQLEHRYSPQKLTIDEYAVSNMFYGMQRFDSQHTEVGVLCGVL